MDKHFCVVYRTNCKKKELKKIRKFAHEKAMKEAMKYLYELGILSVRVSGDKEMQIEQTEVIFSTGHTEGVIMQ